MNHGSRILLLLSGLAIAGTASIAMAAQKGGNGNTVKQHMKVAEKGQFATSPRTMAQADAALVRLPGGALAQPVATELWSYMAVQKDAQGNPHLVETSSPTAPTGNWKGLDHE